MQTLTRKNVSTAVVLILIGSAGIQTSSAISASLFGSLGPFGTSALRMTLAAVIILLLVRPTVRGRSRDEWVGITIYGVAMTMMNLCLYVAISRLPLGIAVTLDFLGPCAIALFASRHIKESVCALISLAGVALISLGPHGYFDLIGYIAGFGAALFFCLYTLFASRVGKTGNGMDGLALSIAVSAICTLPLSITHVQQVTAPQWGALTASAIIGIIIPYTVDTLAGRITSARVILALSLLLIPPWVPWWGIFCLARVSPPRQLRAFFWWFSRALRWYVLLKNPQLPALNKPGCRVSRSNMRAYITERLCKAVRRARCTPSSK